MFLIQESNENGAWCQSRVRVGVSHNQILPQACVYEREDEHAMAVKFSEAYIDFAGC